MAEALFKWPPTKGKRSRRRSKEAGVPRFADKQRGRKLTYVDANRNTVLTEVIAKHDWPEAVEALIEKGRST